MRFIALWFALGVQRADAEETLVVDERETEPRPVKQDLRGHAVDPDKIESPFQKDRFFVDKVSDTDKGTLVQGSVQLSSFLYTEGSGDLPGVGQGTAASKFSRYFGDLRAQVDFRHIAGGTWDARIDLRGRLVNTGAEAIDATTDTETNRVQSGFNGTHELELREAWIVRSGKRSDFFAGRQFITDLGAIKLDGLRLDYAQSEHLTLITFAGLYPVRGSRSVTTDYPRLFTVPDAANPQGQAAGRFVGTAGAGSAYRTTAMHGAFGSVVQVPFGSLEGSRVYATSNGYFRGGATLDVYHYLLVDLIGPNDVAFTNASVGVNVKPDPRLRITASFHRVDTETLGVQAGAFLGDRDGGANSKVQNETFIKQVATNAARVSLSFGLGAFQRFEVTIAGAYRFRPDITLQAPGGTPADAVTLAAAKGIDVSGSIVDRRFPFGLRVGIDGQRTRRIGDVAFQRSEVLGGRLFALREVAGGRGELEVEVAYAMMLDRAAGSDCVEMGSFSPDRCFGSSEGSILSAGSSAYFRLAPDWFVLGNAYVSYQRVRREPMDVVVADPSITGVTGFLRIAYRF